MVTYLATVQCSALVASALGTVASVSFAENDRNYPTLDVVVAPDCSIQAASPDDFVVVEVASAASFQQREGCPAQQKQAVHRPKSKKTINAARLGSDNKLYRYCTQPLTKL